MKAFYIIILLAITFTPLIAQENFQPGYIITQTNEKIEGLIDNKDWRVNPDEIEFRKSASSTSTIYNAITLKEFSVGNRTYWGKIVTLDQSSEKSEDLLKGKNETLQEIDTVFLEVLVQGKISLLYTMSKNRKAHFLVEADGKIDELIVKRTVISGQDAMGNNTGKQVVTTDVFKGQLTNLMRDCATVTPLINKARLATKDLQQLFSKYLNCIGEDFHVEENSNKAQVNLGITAGVFLSSLKFDPEIYSGKFSAFGIPFGMSADVVLAKNRGKLSVYNELFYNNYKYSNSSSTDFKLSYIRLNSMFRVSSVDNGEVRFFGNTGIGFGFTLSTDLPFNDYRKNEYVFNIGGGLKGKNLGIEARYERSTGFSKFININDRISSLYLILNWQLPNKSK